MEVVFPTGLLTVKGPAKAQGSKAKPARWVRAIQSKGQSDTKGGQ
jgi:hypothetical protein